MTKIAEPWVVHWPPKIKGVTVRPIQRDDATLIHAMHQRLSADSIYDRYLQPRIPTAEEIARVCHLEPTTGAGFVATVPKEGGRVVGVAYYVRETMEQHLTAEPGILVEDQFQGKGVGRSLWQQLQQHALWDGLHWLRVLSHPNNQRMARLVQGGLPYAAKGNGGLSEYLVSLGEPLHQSRLQ